MPRWALELIYRLSGGRSFSCIVGAQWSTAEMKIVGLRLAARLREMIAVIDGVVERQRSLIRESHRGQAGVPSTIRTSLTNWSDLDKSEMALFY
jgi:hypothetical protein